MEKKKAPKKSTTKKKVGPPQGSKDTDPRMGPFTWDDVKQPDPIKKFAIEVASGKVNTASDIVTFAETVEAYLRG